MQLTGQLVGKLAAVKLGTFDVEVARNTIVAEVASCMKCAKHYNLDDYSDCTNHAYQDTTAAVTANNIRKLKSSTTTNTATAAGTNFDRMATATAADSRIITPDNIVAVD